MAVGLWRAIQAPLDTDRSRGTGVRRGTSQDAVIAHPIYLDEGHIEVKTAQFIAQRFPFRGDKEPMQLLFKGLKVLNGLRDFSTLTQKGLELIHGVSNSNFDFTVDS